MKYGIVFLVILGAIACKSRKDTIDNGIRDQMPTCNVQESPHSKIIRAINIYGGTYLIENGDTTAIKDYTFYLVDDTLSLAHAFASIKVPEIMKETYTQGRVFLRTTLRSDSTFSTTSILRGIGANYTPVQQQIDRILSGFRLAEPPKDSIVLIFQHLIRLDEY